jgi:hypothetical protein
MPGSELRHLTSDARHSASRLLNSRPFRAGQLRGRLTAPSPCTLWLWSLHWLELKNASDLVAVDVRAAIHTASMADQPSAGQITVDGRLGNAKLCSRGAEGYEIRHRASLSVVIGID